MKSKKGGKKKKGKAKKGKSKHGITSFREQESHLFLKVVQIESYKQAILFYRDEYVFSKEETKKLRLSFRKLQEERYGQIRAVLAETEHMATKVESGEQEATIKLDVNMDSAIMKQISMINDLQDTIDRMIEEVEDCNQKMRELEDFQSRATEEVLQREVEMIQNERDKRAREREQEIEKVKSRHDLSVRNTALRTERIINALEGVASQKELDAMSEHALGEERLNRRLKKEVQILHEDIQTLEALIQEAEDKHMDLLCDNLQVDWNFMYPQDDPWDDYRLEGSDDDSDSSSIEDDQDEDESKYDHLKIPIEPLCIFDSLDETMREIIQLEKQHIEEGLAILGVKGTKTSMSHQADIGPAKFYGHLSSHTNTVH